ncbi:peptidoglycan binding domain protein, partial [Cooperia oncophora]
LAVCLLLLILPPPSRPAPLVTENFDEIVRYLHRFGYLNSPAPSLHEFRTGLRLFQEVVGVEPTGELTPETVEATKRTRCSQKDTRKDTGRSKRFALSGTSKWDKKHFTGLHELSLKWFVSEYTNDIPKAIIR